MAEYGETMRVKDLIAALEETDPEYIVVLEGCDCDGIAGGLDLYGEGEIIIQRQDMIAVRKRYEEQRAYKKDPLEGVPYELRP